MNYLNHLITLAMNLPSGAPGTVLPGPEHHRTAAQMVRRQLLRHYAQSIQVLAEELLTAPPLPAPPVMPLDVERTPAAPEVAPAPREEVAAREGAWDFIQTRDLTDDPVVVLWLGGLHLRGMHLVVCIGASLSGYRRILGFERCSPADIPRLVRLLKGIAARGVSAREGLLCVLPGSSGLYRAVREVFGERVVIQHCLVSTLAQVTDPLPEASRREVWQRMRQAWKLPDAAEAEAALKKIHAEVRQINLSAGKVLMRGLPNTLTIQRTGRLLNVAPGLRVTSCIKGLYPSLRAVPLSGSSAPEGLAQALLDHEGRQRRIAHWGQLPALRDALLNLGVKP